MKSTKKGFTLVELLVVIGILGILMAVLIPGVTGAMFKTQLNTGAMKARKIVQAIISCNIDRERVGYGAVWPRTQASDSGAAGGEKDIAETGYSSAYMYFNDLLDVKRMNNPKEHNAYTKDIKLADLTLTGVTAATPGKELLAENVAWTIGANIQDSLDENVPILISRNMNCGELLKEYTSGRDKVGLGRDGGSKYETPFGNKGFVIAYKSGGALSHESRYSTTDIIYNRQIFKVPEASEDVAEFTYLTPDSVQAPK